VRQLQTKGVACGVYCGGGWMLWVLARGSHADLQLCFVGALGSTFCGVMGDRLSVDHMTIRGILSFDSVFYLFVFYLFVRISLFLLLCLRGGLIASQLPTLTLRWT
jgi:hypothetical protein